MFGSTIDFFGNEAKRRRMSRDLEKQQKIKVARENLQRKGAYKTDEDVFLDIRNVFDRVMRSRIYPLNRRYPPKESETEVFRGSQKKKLDPLIEAVQTFIDHDRLDGILDMKKVMTYKQKKIVEEIIEKNKNLFEERAKLGEMDEEETEAQDGTEEGEEGFSEKPEDS